jgi:DNA-nicking Smr family endonuclease
MFSAMAKGLKTKKAARGAAKAKARPAKGSSAAKEAEPFFRPFTKLKIEKAKTKSAPRQSAGAAARGSGGSGAGGSGAEKSAAKPDGAPKKKQGADRAPSQASAANEQGPELVDPDTFAIYMAGVRALEGRATRIPKTANRIERAAPGALPAADPDANARAQLRSLVTEGLRFESIDDGERLEGRRLDVDPREIRKLRRGMYAVDGKVDLHGMSLEEAREAVTAFVRRRWSEGDRVVAVIHGKGTHSPRGVGVLRGEIGAWLSDGRAARHVGAFATAPDDMGGAGVLLVLLAR